LAVTSAQCSTGTCEKAKLPSCTAKCNGVNPSISWTLTSAPRSTRMHTRSSICPCITQCNGVCLTAVQGCHVCAMFDKDACKSHASFLHRRMQRGPRPSLSWVCAVLDKDEREINAFPLNGQVKRGQAVTVFGYQVGAVLEEDARKIRLHG
jgi:hypothetical protein